MIENQIAVREPGPWVHQNVSAGGVSFHVAVSGDGPHTVLLLHDFPLYWWSWREQLPKLADAGYRAVALDLRGFGGSDIQPGDVSLRRLSVDATSVMRSLGADSVTIVGAGMGGAVGWMVAHEQPAGLRSLMVINSPHPVSYPLKERGKSSATAKTKAFGRFTRRKVRGLQNGRLERSLLTSWSAPAHRQKMGELAPIYSAPMQRHFAAQAALETFKSTWTPRSSDRKLFKPPIFVPVWSIRGAEDPTSPANAYAQDLEYVSSEYVHRVVPGAGRYLSEEDPASVTDLLLKHLQSLGP